MPESGRRHLSKIRAGVTGEHPSASRAGLGRDGSLGLDSCTAAQRRFRAVLALHLFNTNSGLFSSASAFLSYTVAMSPRHNLLVVISRGSIPNIAGRLLPNRDGASHVSGLRITGLIPGRLYHLLHVPTSARMVITDRAYFSSRLDSEIPDDAWGPTTPRLDVPVSASEQQVTDLVSELPDSMLRLLSGLTVRVCTEGPASQWSLGYWVAGWSELSGEGSQWEMRWRDGVDPREVANALTDPVAGIAGARAVVDRSGRTVVTLEDARLDLRQVDGRGR